MTDKYKCSKCNIIKSFTDFYIRRDNGKLRNECKQCQLGEKKIYYINNREILKEKGKKNRLLNREYYREYDKKRWRENPERRKNKRIWNQEHYFRNQKRISARHVARSIVRYKEDPQFKMRLCLSNRILRVLKGNAKSAKTEILIGTSFKNAKKHLENLFLDGMSWKNHGKYGWHIDHIKPCSKFNLIDPAEQKKCFHYTNLQPLWAKDNLKKYNKEGEELNAK